MCLTNQLKKYLNVKCIICGIEVHLFLKKAYFIRKYHHKFHTSLIDLYIQIKIEIKFKVFLKIELKYFNFFGTRDYYCNQNIMWNSSSAFPQSIQLFVGFTLNLLCKIWLIIFGTRTQLFEKFLRTHLIFCWNQWSRSFLKIFIEINLNCLWNSKLINYT